jgi:hypothetical protein
VALGRENVSVTRTDGSADIFRLAGFLRDDDLIGHNGSFGGIDSTVKRRERIMNTAAPQAAFSPPNHLSAEISILLNSQAA